jgi:hypothetical protein
MRIKKIHFNHYKAFKSFSVNFSDFDVLVGPNNAGKSTVLGVFRILSEGIRKANSKKAEWITGYGLSKWGYRLDLEAIPVSLDNVFYEYDQTEPASVTFYLENDTKLILFFPEQGVCFLIPDSLKIVNSPTNFKIIFPIKIGFVPVLGPVEYKEELYQKEAARKALLTHRASRNFRNIWYHYPEEFDEFRDMIQSTWPGMDIKKPELLTDDDKPRLAMFCPEERMDREIYWAGFGFQVWCQMITFILRSKGSTMFVIDEPDIYLHSDLQRQLVSILRNLESQIIIATHSVEIISEVDSKSLLTIHKKRKNATRITNANGLQNVYKLLGSNVNPVLTQLSKTRRALFLEGKDFQILSFFARKLKYGIVANRSDFAVIPVDGFNPTKVKDFSSGIELTLGTNLLKCIIFDRDYRSDDEIKSIETELNKISQFVIIHRRKEIENFLLCPPALDKAIAMALKKRYEGSKESLPNNISSANILNDITENCRTNALSQYLEYRRNFDRQTKPKTSGATSDVEAINEFEENWKVLENRLKIVPGKEILSSFNEFIQNKYKISLTPYMIIDAFSKADMDSELTQLIEKLKKFATLEPPAEKK